MMGLYVTRFGGSEVIKVTSNGTVCETMIAVGKPLC